MLIPHCGCANVQVTLEPCTGGASQTWELLDDNKLFLAASGACLDAALGGAGQTVYTNYCTPSTHGQTWNLTHTGALELPSTSRCIAVPSAEMRGLKSPPSEALTHSDALTLERCGVQVGKPISTAEIELLLLIGIGVF